MKLFTEPNNPHAIKAAVVATAAKVSLTVVAANYSDKHVALPALDLGDEGLITNPNSIALHIASKHANALFDPTAKEANTDVLKWIEWEYAVEAAVSNFQLSNEQRGVGRSDTVSVDELHALLKHLESHLETSKHLSSNFSLADVVVWSTLSVLFHPLAKQETLRSSYAKTAAWFDDVMADANVTKALQQIPFDAEKSKYALWERYLRAFSFGLGSQPVQGSKAPVKGLRNVLVTSALPYVNNVPHLGNIIGCVLSADVYARFCRLRRYNVLYVCGTDEYGTATERQAQKENMTPRQICDKYNKIHNEIYKWFDIGFDHFGRTSTDYQTRVAQGIFHKIHERSLLVEDTVEQLFCLKCDKFLADRFVEGVCPHCSYEDARGDQCDKCGKLLNPTELKLPRCSVDGTTPELRTSKHLFLDLPTLSAELEAWVNQSSTDGRWAPNSIQITKSWLRDGLKPRCITRDLKWGTPVPLEGYEKKVFYVWFDAPIGYISITASLTDGWEEWWLNPKNVELVQFMGKDNIPFHTVIFPSSLIATGQPWTMLHHLSTTEYLNYEDGKFSKSRGTGVFGDHAKESGIPAEVWRYYLLVNRPESQDSVFSWTDLSAKLNAELLANLGNFINRGLSFISANFDGVIPQPGTLSERDIAYYNNINSALANYVELMENVKIKDALRQAMEISRYGNQYLQESEPWKVIKVDRARAGTIVWFCANLVKTIALVFEPFMPSFTQKVQAQLNVKPGYFPFDAKMFLDIPAGHKIGTPAAIFKKLSDEEVAAYRLRFSGQQSQDAATAAAATTSTKAPAKGAKAASAKDAKPDPNAFPLDIRVGRIVDIKNHEQAEKLYILTVDLGSEKRQVVGGFRDFYQPEQLQNTLVAVVCNMKAAKFRGVDSQGLVVVADDGERQHLVSISEGSSDAGILLGAAIHPKDALIPAAYVATDFKDFLKMEFVTVAGGQIAFKGAVLSVNNFAAASVSTQAKEGSKLK
eukprot:TRINITY_DN5538_c0_g2_i1.p1 TRINITY_DN5538_c0_g2~~TRINITY_DN5538_c0_g2_i1.p1  ORF type:complete len:982 (-),score=213.44 TRINITY_DN5538_c0_g2_i1:237-3182(-)